VKRLWRGVPLRIRLVAAVVALVAVGLSISGFVATTSLQSYLMQRTDNQLVGAQTGPNPCPAEDNGPGGFRGGHDFPSQFYVAVYSAAGSSTKCVQQAYNSDDAPNLGTLTPARVAQLSSRPSTVASVGKGPSWRVVAQAEPDGDLRVVGATLSDLSHTVGRLVLVEVVIGLVVLVLLAGAGYLVIRRSLQPLVDVENTAVAIAGGDLSRRVPDLDPRTEVGRLTRALNAMLGQIEHAFARQRHSEQSARASEDRMRRFVADASHELRTPLTSIRGFAELYRQGAVRDPKEVARLMRRVEDEAMRMGMLVDDLLLLARMDQERPLQVIPVDLLTVVADVVHDAQAVAPDRAVALEVLGAPPIVSGDDARLHQVVQNLVTNALRHTPADAPIEVRLRTDERQAVVEVIDHGPGLSPEIRDRVFERFYRVESSRTRDAGGAGLGLSIVAALVSAHGGSVDVAETPGGGATFRVVLPLAPHRDLPAGSQADFSDSTEGGSHG
jgi:two-component system OmpR family sensor kinase